MKLSGIVVATILPFKDNLEIDEDGFRNYLGYLAKSGISGLFCNGHTCEVSKLTREERKRVVELTVEVARKRNIPVIAGIEAEYTKRAVELAQDAEDAGANYAIVLPPYHTYGAMAGSRVDPEGEMAFRHHKTIAENVGLPLILFKYPTKSNVTYSREALRKLCTIDQVAAIKMTNFDLHDFQEDLILLREARPDISVLTADDILLTFALLMGADGASAGICNIAPHLWVEAYDAAKSGDVRTAMRIQEQLYPIMKATHDPLTQHVVRLKAALVEMGLLKKVVVRGPPYASNKDVEAIREALARTPILREKHQSYPPKKRQSQS